MIRVEAEEAHQKREGAEKLRQEWLNQSLTQNERREGDIAQSIKRFASFNINDCSLASAQMFEGEDTDRHERRRMQAAQIREWTLSQMAEKKIRDDEERVRDKVYAESMENIGRFQQDAELEYEREKARQAIENRRYNESIVAYQRSQKLKLKQENQQMDDEEIRATNSSTLLNETVIQSKTANPNRVRCDHWKGMSKEEAKNIVCSNEEIIQTKKQQKVEKIQAEVDEAQVQNEIRRQMTEYEYEAEKKKVRQTLEVQQTLKRQADEAKERLVIYFKLNRVTHIFVLFREKKQKELSQGKIEKSFFNYFGKSFR